MTDYTKGASCGRGQHVWEQHPTYLKCSKCGSSRGTKPRGAPKTRAPKTPGSTRPTPKGNDERFQVLYRDPRDPPSVSRYAEVFTTRAAADEKVAKLVATGFPVTKVQQQRRLYGHWVYV